MTGDHPIVVALPTGEPDHDASDGGAPSRQPLMTRRERRLHRERQRAHETGPRRGQGELVALPTAHAEPGDSGFARPDEVAVPTRRPSPSETAVPSSGPVWHPTSTVAPAPPVLQFVPDEPRAAPQAVVPPVVPVVPVASAPAGPPTADEARSVERPAPQGPSPWFFPAVDGLRGIAIASVLLYHTNWSPRGLFGVDVFFVISGFLITLLLLRELGRTGRIDLGSFFAKRVKRLVPGLLVTLAVVLLLVWIWGTPQELRAAADKAVFSVLQIANWRQLTSGDAYWDQAGQISPLAHMWSLSITEQFYVVWPFVLLGLWFVCRRRPRAVVVALIGLALASAAVAPLMWDGSNSDRLYLGTETRAVGFVAGALMAAVVYARTARRIESGVRGEPTAAARFGVTTVSVVSLAAVLAASVLTTSYHEPWLYQGGIAAVALAAAVFTASLCSEANMLSRFFAARAFTSFGRVSYTVYLLHLPVYWFLIASGRGIEPLGLFVVGGGVTWLVALVLHHGLTERLRLAPWRVSRAVPALGIACAVVLVAGVYGPGVKDAQLSSTDVLVTDADRDFTLEPGHAGGRPVVLTLGDSLANDVATMLVEHGTGSFAVVDGGVGGCGIFEPDGKVRASSGYEWTDQARCASWRTSYPRLIESHQPDLVVVHTSWDAAEQLLGDRWLEPRDREWADRYRAHLDQLVGWVAASAPHAQIVLMTDRPTNGIISDPDQMRAFNDVMETYAAETSGVLLLDLHAALCPDGTSCRSETEDGQGIYLEDDVHLADDGMEFLVPWLERQLAQFQSTED
ncbi:acyltransferase family protein [Cellulosimicrobium cellulans]|uniref:Acyltransferase n=1 Tax=Cellulosimicrobium cellulans TaxID=1710 RepID=A0A4Y4E082_CELCE|nr:acyltransferase family protein [Cellulosimicrobium cellulans]GED08021.1 acyltransferase [Cellulosimicrobium cellulans]